MPRLSTLYQALNDWLHLALDPSLRRTLFVARPLKSVSIRCEFHGGFSVRQAV
jgi:hypothetical protein